MMKQNNLPVVRSIVESLEERCLFAAISLNSSVMNVTGSMNQSNKLAISMDSSGHIWGIADNYGSSYLPTQVSAINLNEGSANDQYNISADVPVAIRIIGPTGTVIKTIAANSAAVSSSSSGSAQTTPPVVDPTAPVAKITTDSATAILPGQSAFVDALSSTLTNGTSLTTKYQWDFGDPTSQYNQLVGFNAGHAYETPGTYTITLTVTDSLGKISTATQTVFVSADTRPTLYVNSLTGSDSNSGSTSAGAIKSLAKLNQIIQPNEIVLFARGDTFGCTSFVNAQSNDTFDAYGTGAAPILQWQGGDASGNTIILAYTSGIKDVVVQNLAFDTLNPGNNPPEAIAVSGDDITVRNNTFLNLGDCVNANGSPDGLLLQGNSQPLVAGMQGYLVWFQGQDGVIIGNTSVNSTRQHNIRANVGFSRLLIEDNNLQNLDRSSIDPQDYSKSAMDIQYGSYIYINGNTCTDGNIRLGPLDGDEIDSFPTTALAERETWVVVEDNIINASDIEVHPGTVDAMVRNNVINQDNAPAIYIYAYDPTYNNIVQGVSFLNNTMINHGTNGNAFYVTGQTSGVVLANNLYIAPNFEPGFYASTAPVYVDYSDLSGFASISNNIWPEPTLLQRIGWANGGVNYISTAFVQSGFYTEAAWDRLPGVNNDIFSTVPLNVGDQATVAGVTAGANLAVAG